MDAEIHATHLIHEVPSSIRLLAYWAQRRTGQTQCPATKKWSPLRLQWDDKTQLQGHHSLTPELQDIQESLLQGVLASAAQWRGRIPWGFLEMLLYKLHRVRSHAVFLDSCRTQSQAEHSCADTVA